MKMNRLTGMFSGTGDLTMPMVFTRYRGQQRIRRKPASVTVPQTGRRLEVARIFTEITQEADCLTLYQRNLWANCFFQGASIREKKGNVRFAWFMKRHDIRPMDWRTAFVYCNMLAAFSFMKYPRKKAPVFAKNFPPSPRIEANFNEGKFIIEGKVRVYSLNERHKEGRIRLWVALQYVQGVKGYIFIVFDVGDGPQSNVEIPFTIDIVRCAGTVFGVETLPIKDMLFGSIFVYADMVAPHGPEWGPLPSAYSNIAQIVLPKRARYIHTKGRKCKFVVNPDAKVSKFALKLVDRLRKYKKKHRGHRGLTKLVFAKLSNQNKMARVLQCVGKTNR